MYMQFAFQDTFAILAAAAASMAFGALFYSRAAFLPLWLKYAHSHHHRAGVSAAGNVKPAAARGTYWREMASAGCADLVAAIVLSVLLGHPATLGDAITRAFIVGFGVAGMTICRNYTFAKADPALFFTDILFCSLQYTLMGAVLFALHSAPPAVVVTMPAAAAAKSALSNAAHKAADKMADVVHKAADVVSGAKAIFTK